MDKNKDPAFLFYSSDFLTGTMFMSDEQVGKYIRLMCAQHQKGHLKEKDMLNICKTYDEDIFSKFVTDENGNYYNVRLDNEIHKRAKYSESRRNNRLSKPKGNEKKEEDMNNICQSYVEHMENENENEIKDINKVIKHKYGSYENVLLSDTDYQKLLTEFPSDYTDRIERLSEYIASKGAKYKSHLATIRSWSKKDKPQEPQKVVGYHEKIRLMNGVKNANTRNDTTVQEGTGGIEQPAYDYEKFFS